MNNITLYFNPLIILSSFRELHSVEYHFRVQHSPVIANKKLYTHQYDSPVRNHHTYNKKLNDLNQQNKNRNAKNNKR